MSATNAKKTTPPKVDWSLAPRGVVSATAQATMGLVAVGGAADIAHISPVFAGLGAGVGALSHVIAASVQGKYTPGAIVYRLACWTGAGAWATWATWAPNHWWNLNGLAALAVGAVGAGIMAPIGRHTHKTTTAGQAAGTEVARIIGPVGQAWESRFKRVCNVKVTVTEIIRWDNGAGYDVVGLLPPGPATRGRIDDVGPGVHVGGGAGRRRAGRDVHDGQRSAPGRARHARSVGQGRVGRLADRLAAGPDGLPDPDRGADG